MASLKGPKHGGANIKVTQMFEDMKKNVHDWEDKDEVRQYLCDLLDKKAFDQKGLIYGMGHRAESASAGGRLAGGTVRDRCVHFHPR